MKVSEYFESYGLDSFFIDDNFDSDYWRKADQFVSENWYEEFEDLSKKQQDWLFKIIDACAEKLEKSKQQEAGR